MAAAALVVVDRPRYRGRRFLFLDPERASQAGRAFGAFGFVNKRCALWVALALFAWLASAPAQTEPSARETLDEFFDDNCLACHRGRRAKGKIDLTSDAVDWRKVKGVLERRTMPPETEEAPTETEYKSAIAALAQVRSVARTGPPPPVTMRRLNRAEYIHTLRDLLGVDFDATAYFPADEVGHGFDNIADVLSISPALLEKYVDAAERIAALAVVDETPTQPRAVRYEGRGLRIEGGGNKNGGRAFFFANGTAWTPHEFERNGEYVFEIRAYGQQAGPEVVQLALQLDRRNVHPFAVPAVENKPGTYQFKVRVQGGARRVGVAFLNDYYQPRHPDPKQRDRNAVVLSLAIVGPVDKQPLPISQRRILPRPPPKTGHAAYLREVMIPLAERAWRRPLEAAEKTRLLQMIDKASPQGASVEARVRVGIVALLTSPHFLFRLETPDAQGRRRRDPFELASRLSYFLWSSTPDDALLALARSGKLAERNVLVSQVRRLLRDARASSLAQRFASQWLQIGRVEGATPDPGLFPDFDDTLRRAMRAETEMVFDAVLREHRSIWELIDNDFTFVNEPLAKLYGLPGVRGMTMRRVHLPKGRRGGVLTHASVLTATSNPTRTSPVKRGKWVLEVLLDAPPPPPPPGVDDIDESPEAVAAATFKERLQRHRQDAACAQCHARMDTLGFALEHYDAIGRWRTADGKHPIDASGVLPGGQTIKGAADLRAVVRADAGFLRSLAKNMLVYALGRGLLERDEPALESLVKTLEATPRLDALIVALVQLDAFWGVAPK